MLRQCRIIIALQNPFDLSTKNGLPYPLWQQASLRHNDLIAELLHSQGGFTPI